MSLNGHLLGLLFHKIHSGAASIEKDKYVTPAHSLKSTRSSHSAQYCRYQTYSDQSLTFLKDQLEYKNNIKIIPTHGEEFCQLYIHTGKCIRRCAGIYAYCRYFIDRKW